MAKDIALSKNNIPLWNGGNGNLNVHIERLNPDQSLEQTADDLVSLNFGVTGNNSLPLGDASPNSIKLGIKADTSVKLTPIWPADPGSPQSVLGNQDQELADYFNSYLQNKDELILALRVGASADASAATQFQYQVLQANVAVDAGGDVGYSYFRPYEKTEAALGMIQDFFANLQLPATVSRAPKAGEVTRFEYGGYLGLNAGLSVGYQMKGAKSFNLSDLRLSESYDVSLLGSLSLAAKLAGRFAIEVRAAEDQQGKIIDGWARVIVRKQRTSQLNIAADVKINATNQVQGLPGSADEFLGALFGVNSKNWFNLFQNISGQIQQIKSPADLKSKLDSLAQHFIAEYTGKAIDSLPAADLQAVLNDIQMVADQYNNADKHVINLFDRYFNKVDVLEAKLLDLQKMLNQEKAGFWDKLKDNLKLPGDNDVLINAIEEFTGGDPLGWILSQARIPDGDGGAVKIPTIDDLVNRVNSTLALIQNKAHAEITRVITLAKNSFPFRGLLEEVLKIKSKNDLKTLVNTKAGAFAERLIGKAIDDMGDKDVKIIITVAQKWKDGNDFAQSLYNKFTQALNSSLDFNLHAVYNASDERNALVDVMINLGDAAGEGRSLMRDAARGDFENVLAKLDPDLVKINQGLLTHKATQQSSLNVNVLGWHTNFQYQSLYRVITNTEQQIRTEANGGLSVFTQIDLTAEGQHDEKTAKQHKTMYTNFLLRFIGESHGVLEFDKKNQQYLIDTISSMAANYKLSFTNSETTTKDLTSYLSFAKDFDLDKEGATVDQLKLLLPKVAEDDYGQVSLDYEARYTDEGLRALFNDMPAPDVIRMIMREIVVANYNKSKDSDLPLIAWAYWTQAAFNEWKQNPAGFAQTNRVKEFIPSNPPFGLQAPARVQLGRANLSVLATLFSIESSLVDGLQKLGTLIENAKAGATKLKPKEFEDSLSQIGSALNKFDSFDEGFNTIFAVFDNLVNQNLPSDEARASSLKLTSQAGAQQASLMFIAQPKLKELLAGSANA
jgi:hypothetical protein